MLDVIIIGGGIAGLINATLLARGGLQVLLIEKKKYPFHRVCGEYISNEVKPFLINHGLYPEELEPSQINQFSLSSVSGRVAKSSLEMGGFGVSRYDLDYYLLAKAKESGAEILEGTAVSDVRFVKDHFILKASGQEMTARLVIGAFGKRSTLDREMQRSFMTKRSPYLGVKYHIKTDFPLNEIALHNFKDGYCGISSVGKGIYNLCYLSHRKNLAGKTILEMEHSVLHQNPHLKNIWTNSDFLFEQPMVINEISFEKKRPVEQHVLMCGDTAGMITPLCGNGMAMAVRAAAILSEIILEEWTDGDFDRDIMKDRYTVTWNNNFASRLWVGRQFQRLFGAAVLSDMAVGLVKSPAIARSLISLSHGEEF